jgi:outer membrane protein assembly factor BamB/two-component sensor histidine kinase
MLFTKVQQLRKEKLYNQAILTLLEACCNGTYQNYKLTTGPHLNKIAVLPVSENLHYVLAAFQNNLSIKHMRTTKCNEETTIEFPSTLTSIAAFTDRKGIASALVGSESGQVWQIMLDQEDQSLILIDEQQTTNRCSPIHSFATYNHQLLYSPLGDPTIHCYDLLTGSRTLFNTNNYSNVAQIHYFTDREEDYCSLGYTDQEKEVPLLSLYTTKEQFLRGVEEIEGSVTTLQAVYLQSGEPLILAGTEKSTIFAVDCHGTVIWKYKTDGPINCMAVSYRPGTNEPYIFAGDEGGTLYLLDCHGAMKWKKVFNTAVKDCALLTISKSHYPHILIGLADSTIYSFCRSPAEDLSPLLSELLSDIIQEEESTEESLFHQFTKSDYQTIRDFGEIKTFGFQNTPALLILQFTHLGRPLEEIIELVMPYRPTPQSLARLAEFRLNYENRRSEQDTNLKRRFENLYQRGDLKDAFLTGCHLAYQSYDIHWITQLSHPADYLIPIDSNRFFAIAEQNITLIDRLMPSKDIYISLPSKIVACFDIKKQKASALDPTFLAFTKDLTLHYYSLPLQEKTTIALKAPETGNTEIREKSVALSDNLFTFSTTDKKTYIYSLSPKRTNPIRQFSTTDNTRAATFSIQQDEARIVLGTSMGKLLVYRANGERGNGASDGAATPLWTGEIEGMVECIVSARTSQGITIIIVGSSSGAAKAFDFEGNLLWEFRTITENLQAGRGLRTIIPVGGQDSTPLYCFLLAGEHIYVLNEEGKLTKFFKLPDIAQQLLLVGGSEVDQPSFLVLFTSTILNHTTYYLKNPLSRELDRLYPSLTTSSGEEKFVLELIESKNPPLQAFAFQKITHLLPSSTLLQDVLFSFMKHLHQQDSTLRRVIIKGLEKLLIKNWDPTLLLDNIDFDDLYQFSGMMSLLHKVGETSDVNRENVIDFLKSVYALTTREANHIAILQLLEKLLKETPSGIAQFLFDITPFENSHWVSQEIGIILGRTLGKNYAENFNVLTKCFYVSSLQELKALSEEIKDNLPFYQPKFTENGIKALTLFASIDWDEKERMDDPFRTELQELKKFLNEQSHTIATALFRKWERILCNVSTAEIKLGDLSVEAWHKVESLNSHVRHSIVEGCFSGLESFSLLLKEQYNDPEIVAGIRGGISQLSMVRRTLKDYFEGCIDQDIRLKDVFFLEYKNIFKEMDEIEKLCAQFSTMLSDSSFREHFFHTIPKMTRVVQRENLARIDLEVKMLKTDIRSILEKLLENISIKHALKRANIAVNLNLKGMDSSQFRILAREHQLLNAFYELINNVIKHAFPGTFGDRPRKLTISAECHSWENLFLTINLTDNGIGMTSHELSRIRDISFTRGGTGEGIERVVQLIKHNLGLVTYRSTKGEGTTVSVSLPLKIRKENEE